MDSSSPASSDASGSSADDVVRWNGLELIEIRPRSQKYGCAIRLLATRDYARLFIGSDEYASDIREVDAVERAALAERFSIAVILPPLPAAVSQPTTVGPQSSTRLPTSSLDYHTPQKHERVREPYVPITRMQLQVAIAAMSLLLTAASFYIVYRDASVEPYRVYRRSDAIIQLGLGMATIVLWLVFCVLVMLLAGTRKISMFWLILVAWMMICLFYLSFGPVAYLEDLQMYVIPKVLSTP